MLTIVSYKHNFRRNPGFFMLRKNKFLKQFLACWSFLSLIYLVESTAWPSFLDDDEFERAFRQNGLSPRNVECDENCQNCLNSTTETPNMSCYIGKNCYQANDTRSNETFSYLQCRPDENRFQWSFSPWVFNRQQLFWSRFYRITSMP